MNHEVRFNDPGKIGDLPIKNRIVMAPMISNLANPDGSTNETHTAYLEERAIGGVGLIITEYTYVDSLNSKGSRNELGAYSTDFIPKLRRLNERVHRHGTRIFMQLVHAGGKALEYSRQPMAPSSVDYPGRKPREMTLDDIDHVINAFSKAASIAERSNFDGIELHGAHGYLLQEFISPSLNRRTDRYGGSFDGRLRLPQEIIDAVRGKVRIPVGIRLSLYEDDGDGYDAGYGLSVAESLSGIDYVHFSAGRFAPPGSSASFYSDRTHIYARLPRKPKITTILVGSVTSAADVENVLKKSDFVALGRGLLADPNFAYKISRNVPVRPCIRCNQGCRDLSYGEVRCTVNVDLGFEGLRKNTHRFTGEIAIVGAGVKGIEAATLASKIGFKTVLYEKNDRIGGQLLEIYDPFKRREFDALLGYYEYTLKRLNVEIHTGEKYSGKAVYCAPDTVYEQLPERDGLKINSNLYQHHDEALRIAGKFSVTMTRKSLSSLDRARADGYERYATSLGMKFDDSDDGDVNVMEKDQYDIRRAIISGRERLMNEIMENSPDYL